MDEKEMRLVECFLSVFPDVSKHNVACASSASVPSWDSVATVTLLAVVEEEFGISLDIKELAKFDSFEGILSLLREANPERSVNSCDEDIAV